MAVGRDRPPPRVTGMLGPDTPDEFGEFDGYQPPARRSQIDEFTVADARSVLDGDVSLEDSREIAKKLRLTMRTGKRCIIVEHGGHRHGTNWGKSEFPFGWAEHDVVDFVRRIVDSPTGAAQTGFGFTVSGSYQGVVGVIVVNPTGGVRWFIATAYPTATL